MYNLDINMTTSLNVGGPTPRTPEIVNSLIAMTNPLDYNFGGGVDGGATTTRRFYPNNANSDSNSSTGSSTANAHTPDRGGGVRNAAAAAAPPPIIPTISVQQTCSQLIKAGLKLTIEQKRKQNANDNEDLLDLDKIKVKRIKRNESESEEDKAHSGSNIGLTPEDEERRRRRRERNKIAATKCRLKKRERTANLMAESETLEAQNIDLKHQYEALKKQRQDLEDALGRHKTCCKIVAKNTLNISISCNSATQGTNNLLDRLAEVHSLDADKIMGTSVPIHSPYSTTDYLEYDDRPLYHGDQPYKSPNVDDINDDDSYQTCCLADLDNPGETYSYNSSQVIQLHHQQNISQQCHQNYQQQNANTNSQSQSYGINGCMA